MSRAKERRSRGRARVADGMGWMATSAGIVSLASWARRSPLRAAMDGSRLRTARAQAGERALTCVSRRR
jgi:hypothetical protein